MSQQTICVLGATGSIGLSTLDIIRRNPDMFRVTAITANSRVHELAELAREFAVETAVIGNENLLPELKSALSGTGVQCAAGDMGLLEAAGNGSDIVMAAIVGAAGLRPTLEAIKHSPRVAVANKECLVCAGEVVLRQAKASGTKLLPVDSEHNAIFQVFERDRAKSVEKIILTASGGPFLNRGIPSLKAVTPEEAIKHPNWDMGRKISIDSATMMNKGLEVIEAFHLFPVNADQIEVVIHPQSVIHSMVQYCDGSVLAQLGSPDMRTPIAYSLAWPDRMNAPVERLSLPEIGKLTFEEPCLDRFPCLALAIQALQAGGAAPAVLNAANEVAVQAFLDRQIGFMDISYVVQESLGKADMKAPQSLSMVFETDMQARLIAEGIASKIRH